MLGCDEPPYEILGHITQLLVRWEVQVARPVDDLAVRIGALLGAEWGPTDQTLKCDRAHAPPVARKVVAFPGEDLGSDVVGSADGRVGELASRLAPRVDLVAIADRELDLVEVDAVAVVAGAGFGRLAVHELLVVRRIVLFVETSREAEVCQLDVAMLVKQDVVGFDVTCEESAQTSYVTGHF